MSSPVKLNRKVVKVKNEFIQISDCTSSSIDISEVKLDFLNSYQNISE